MDSQVQSCWSSYYSQPYPQPNVIAFSGANSDSPVGTYSFASTFVIWGDVADIGIPNFVAIYRLLPFIQILPADSQCHHQLVLVRKYSRLWPKEINTEEYTTFNTMPPTYYQCCVISQNFRDKVCLSPFP